MKSIAFSCLLIMLQSACNNKVKNTSYILIPGVGVGEILIGKPMPREKTPNGLTIFDDANGFVKAVVAERSHYILTIGDRTVNIGDKFESINSRIKETLVADNGTSDVLGGSWYKSKNGFFICVEKGEIVRLGVGAAGD